MLTRRTCLAAPFAFAATAANAQVSQTFPSKPVQIILPYSAGGLTDNIARAIALRLGDKWKQPVIVDNRPGAGTMIGTALAAKAPGDGHTLLMTGFSLTANRLLVPTLPYDPQALTPVMIFAEATGILFVNASLPVNTVTELVAYAKANPGKVSFASAGNGSTAHMATELFAARTGIDIVHIPYKGNGPAINDVVGGQVSALFDAQATMSFVAAGKLKALGCGSLQPMARLPQLPPIARSGIPALADFTVTPWYGLFMPASTPADLQRRIYQDVRAVMETREMTDAIQKTGVDPKLLTQAESVAYLKRDLDTWGPIVRERKIKLD